jgi:hypothetical protein
LPEKLSISIQLKLKPDYFLVKRKKQEEESDNLEFCVLKIVHRLADLGIGIKQVFEHWDTNNNKTCKHHFLLTIRLVDISEIMTGINSYLGIHFTQEEVYFMTKHLDKDRNGVIDI